MPGMEMRAPERTENSKGSFGSANFLPTMFDAFLNLFFQIRGERFAVRIIIRANFGRNRKARGNGNSDSAHFSQVRTFAAQQISVGGITFGFSVAEFINPFCHGG